MTTLKAVNSRFFYIVLLVWLATRERSKGVGSICKMMTASQINNPTKTQQLFVILSVNANDLSFFCKKRHLELKIRPVKR